VEYAKSFSGGGGEVGVVLNSPTSGSTTRTATAPRRQHHSRLQPARCPGQRRGAHGHRHPGEVLNQNGSGWSSVVARGITYVADLKAGLLADYPVVINMSLGGPTLDAMEQEAIDYAVEMGVIVVASAGNEGEEGMGYPGAYAPVISVAASGWVGEWTPLKVGAWWWSLDVADPTVAEDFYITDFSSRELTGQDLDVAAPGSWVVGPYKVNSGNRIFITYLGAPPWPHRMWPASLR